MKEILKEKYGAYRAVRMTGGFTNATYWLKGDTSNLVAKVANLSNRDIENEKFVLYFLKDKAFTPQMFDSFMSGDSQVIVTHYMSGRNGQAILDAGDIRLARKLFSKMGRCLAQQIHSCSFDGNRHKLRIGQSGPFQFDNFYLSETLREKCNSLVSESSFREQDWVLTHGDFGAHNLLIEDESEQLTVIDWEWAEWFHPLVDLAWTCWNTKLHYPHLADQLLADFLKAYLSVKPILFTEEELMVFVLYKLHTILTRMELANKETQKKWTHRLEWTLDSDWTYALNSDLRSE